MVEWCGVQTGAAFETAEGAVDREEKTKRRAGHGESTGRGGARNFIRYKLIHREKAGRCISKM